MHPRHLALVGFRVVAVYFGIQSIGYLAQCVQFTVGTLAPQTSTFTGALVSLVPLAVAILLWRLAPGLSTLATAEVAAMEKHASLSADELTRCGLMIVGIFILVTTLPTLLMQLVGLADPEKVISLPHVVSLALQCGLAIAVVAGADAMTRVLTKLKRSGDSQ